MINDGTHTAVFSNSATLLLTQNADRIRVGRPFYDPDARYMAARISCIQLYDIPMTLVEMRALEENCLTLADRVKGTPSGLVLIYPFNRQSACHSTDKKSQLFNVECVLSVRGPRNRVGEGLYLSTSAITGNHVLLKHVSGESSLVNESSFTIMFYIRLDTIKGNKTHSDFCCYIVLLANGFMNIDEPIVVF